ncbi:TPA: hypothetical protein DIV55_05680 [Patescibacteria group bacterium]|uniref:Uncharacterized protein n=1 Tax=Candidatus Gottesmanbacteria bacterium GW2011_GWA1_43_11 TaxID=1618436 RepID=A0A0G1CJF1_9BACT|nr:MAG: hypothetical protein UV59_C0006G0070 [Candidatus Gottesmanbacteria bacterium GW2011_GWA1_43_11]HCS79199.1 hypothetical protein [Patescibacteria group bacterium]
MKKLIFTFLLLLITHYLLPSPVFAGTCTNPGATGCALDLDCRLVGVAGGNQGTCDQVSPGNCQCNYVLVGPGGSGAGTSCGIFGCITNPLPTTNPAPGGGLIQLLNNLLRLIFVAGGIYAFIRVVLAGLKFMSAGGDSKAIEAAWNSIWQSILGVVIIISSLALAALMGLVLFGDATAILHPVIFGPTPLTP